MGILESDFRGNNNTSGAADIVLAVFRMAVWDTGLRVRRARIKPPNRIPTASITPAANINP